MWGLIVSVPDHCLSFYFINIQRLCLMLLLFEDPVKLQLLLNKLYKYSTEWGHKVNTSKTKICVFLKRRSNIDFN